MTGYKKCLRYGRRMTMSKINAIRLINLNYNNDSIRIADETFRMNGENTLLSLRNGGGKTVLVQMMTAPFVHKRYRDTKDRPFESYFQTNKPTFILVEWELDAKEGYVLTGMMVRKNQNVSELQNPEKLEIIQFISYYRENCERDLYHFPVIDKKEDHMTLKGFVQCKKLFENYKKEFPTEFFVYDMSQPARTRQYFDQLHQYGIHYKEWEGIIKKINLKESGLSELFADCKEEKGLVEKWFLDVIENKLNKETNRVREFQTLMMKYIRQYRENQTKIERLENVSSFQKEASALQQDAKEYLSMTKSRYDKEDRLTAFYRELVCLCQKVQEQEKQTFSQMDALKERSTQVLYEQISYDIYRQQDLLLDHERQKEALQKEQEQLFTEQRKVQKEKAISDAYELFKEQKDAREDIKTFSSHLEFSNKDRTQKDAERERLGAILAAQYLALAQKKEAELEQQKKEYSTDVEKEKELTHMTEEAKKEQQSIQLEIAKCNEAIRSFDTAEEQFAKQYDKALVRNILGEYSEQAVRQMQEEIAQKKQDKKQKRLLVLQQKNQTEEAFYHTSRALEDLRSRQLDLFKQIERAAAKREDIEQEYQSRADILQHLELSESAFYDTGLLLDEIQKKIDKTAAVKRNLEREKEVLLQGKENLKTGVTTTLSQEFVSFLEQQEIPVVYAAQWIEQNISDSKKKKELFAQNPFLPYALLMKKEEVQKLALAGEKRMLAFPLPIVEWEKLEQYRFSTQKGLTTIDSIHFYTFFEDVILTKEEREEKEKSYDKRIKKIQEKWTIRNEEYEKYLAQKDMIGKQTLEADSLKRVQKEWQQLKKKEEALQGEEHLLNKKSNTLFEEQKAKQEELLETQKELQLAMQQEEALQEWLAAYKSYQKQREKKDTLSERLNLSSQQNSEQQKELLSLREQCKEEEQAIFLQELTLEKLQKEKEKYSSYQNDKETEEVTLLSEDVLAECKAGFEALGMDSHQEKAMLEEQLAKAKIRLERHSKALEKLLKKHHLTKEEVQENYRPSFVKKMEAKQEELSKKENVLVQNLQTEVAQIAVAKSRISDLKEKLHLKCNQTEPLPKEKVGSSNFEQRKEENRQEYILLDRKKEELQRRRLSYENSIQSLADFKDKKMRQECTFKEDFLTMEIRQTEDFRSALWKEYMQSMKKEQESRDQITKQLHLLLCTKEFMDDFFAKPLHALSSLTLDASAFLRQLEMIIESYESLSEKLKIDIAMIQKEREHLAGLLLEYVKNIHQNLGKIDRNSTITIHGKEIKMLKIHLPDWKQNEEAYRINLEDLVTTVTQKGLALLDKNENLEEMTGVYINTNNLYDTVVGTGNVEILLYKIEEQKEYQISWSDVAKNSGGEGFLSAFIILSSLLQYMRWDDTDLFANRNEGKVLVMDNPFAQTNAKHLLKPLMDMAKKTNTQLICLSGLGGDSIYSCFDNIYVLNLITANFGKSMQYLKGDHMRGAEPSTMTASRIQVEQQSLLF